MMSVDEGEWTLDFCGRWIAKASLSNDQLLNEAFDKFFSLFVAYNRLYCYMFPGARDAEAATKLFPEKVGYEKIWLALTEGDGSEDVTRLRTLIEPETGEFFLFINRKTRRREKAKNKELFTQLGSASVEEKVLAVLLYLYKVRCNVFHGTKALHERQLLIMQPSIHCLARVVQVGMSEVAPHVAQGT